MILVLIQGIIFSWFLGLCLRYLICLIKGKRRTFKSLMGVGKENNLHIIYENFTNFGVGIMLGVAVVLLFRYL